MPGVCSEGRACCHLSHRPSSPPSQAGACWASGGCGSPRRGSCSCCRSCSRGCCPRPPRPIALPTNRSSWCTGSLTAHTASATCWNTSTSIAPFPQTHPGTVVTVLDLFDGRESLRPLWEQVQGFGEAVAPIMAKAPEGVHLICYSQGGLVCRALLSVMDEHNVDSFISLSSPQMGQYGDTDYLKWLFPTSMRSNLYRICYSPWGQEFSICNYWHDPHHDDLYLNASSFLALINGERDHPNATAWRKNFLRVGRLVLIGGPDDGVITPWQSSFFGFYDANETVLEMEEQPVYLRDSFGLKTLLARGAIVRCPMAGISHTAWHSNRTLYEACIEPWLS
ncbi:lysosomal thioesterase PPT2 isoform X2 [Halichoerus grypus]|uniref:lysosomal thioesterase PPT2 isoform X1 n=1 Tax=Phoca vitulina TaxID=9720 RepID=UPI001396265B|nr:lysosomal thioesterase PPT2 isoform X1 [Phoca vitulina]XP_035964086.1 lysosomal thioesterase PPT2 isoform X1 [Halichoerus grypus]